MFCSAICWPSPREQLVTFAVLLVLLAACIGFIYRPLLYTSVNVEVAQAKGLPVRLLSMIFMALLGLAITMAVQAVGTLLLFALVVTPAATAIMLTPKPPRAMIISTVISVVSVWLGVAMSAMFNLPPSFVIVTIACGVWFVVWLLERHVRPRSTAAQRMSAEFVADQAGNRWRRPQPPMTRVVQRGGQQRPERPTSGR